MTLSPSFAQEQGVSEMEARGIIGPCEPQVYMQLVDTAQMQAEIQKKIIELSTDESEDPSILSLSCFEEDINKLLDAAESIIQAASSGINLGTLANFYQSNKAQIQAELQAAAGKFACENIRNFIKNQIDQCFDFRLIERQSSQQLGNQACIISASAAVTINRHGYLYTGIEASGQVSGPGGFEESALLGVGFTDGDIAQGLSDLYNNWGDSSGSYEPYVVSCRPLDPDIVEQYGPDYYLSLAAGELPEGVVLDGDIYVYTNVGTYSNNGSAPVPYESNAFCYGFEMSLPYVPCGYEDDGVTPAPCGVEAGEDPSCCHLSADDCSVSGLDAVCPCTQGNLNSFAINEDTGVAECLVGIPTCCDGTLNDCTLYTDASGNLLYPYCEDTEPEEEEEEVDCDEVLQDLQSQLVYTPDEIIANCDEELVEEVILNTNNTCDAFDGPYGGGAASECNALGYCEASVSFPYINCFPTASGLRNRILQACNNALTNQNIIDNFDYEDCEFTEDEIWGTDGSQNRMANPNERNNEIMNRIMQFAPANTGEQQQQPQVSPANSGSTAPAPATRTAPAPTAVPVAPSTSRTAPAPTTATPTQTPSAGSTDSAPTGTAPAKKNTNPLRNLF